MKIATEQTEIASEGSPKARSAGRRASLFSQIEWPTVALLLGCYGAWLVALFLLAPAWPVAAILLAGVSVALHASLQHEIIHGHPTPHRGLNAGLVFPALTLLIPFLRFRDTHIAHHMDARLTDPFDDPESNFLAARDWAQLGRPMRALLAFNNTLLGRLLIGVIVAQLWFMRGDLALIRAGDRSVLRGWLWHLPALALVLGIVAAAPMSLWHYVIAAYIGNALIKIRTFAEHQAHEISGARTAIIEDRGPLALLFLNNNLHHVHHAHPGLAWYALPRQYFGNREAYLAGNLNYRFRSYGALFARYLLRRKDPVPHPLWRRD